MSGNRGTADSILFRGLERQCSKSLLHTTAGEAINPRNLSTCERFLGVGKNYNKQLDREDLYDDAYVRSPPSCKAYASVSTNAQGCELQSCHACCLLDGRRVLPRATG